MPIRFPPWKPGVAGRRNDQRRPLQRVAPVGPAASPPMDAYDRAIAAILTRSPEMTLHNLLAYLHAANAELRKELADLDGRIAKARTMSPFTP